MNQTLTSQLVADSIRAISFLQLPSSIQFIEKTAAVLVSAFQQGKKTLAIGNGGSLCDAAHFAEELTGFFRHKRSALPAIAITDPGHISCVANDIGYEWVFARGIAALGQPGDVLIALSTSGKSPSIINAIEEAKKSGIITVAFLGKGGGPLKNVADLELIVDGFDTSDRIQEAHMAALHIIIELVERSLFPDVYLAEAIKAASLN